MTNLMRMLEQSPYRSYVYAYPHKTAYRLLDQPVPLSAAWAEERRDALFLYMHIPFCEMRCGFCNLFTTVNPKGDMEALYLETLERQARRVQAALGLASFARLAIGGGRSTSPAAWTGLSSASKSASVSGRPIIHRRWSGHASWRDATSLTGAESGSAWAWWG